MARLTDLPLSDARQIGLQLGVEVETIQPLLAGSVNSNFWLRCASGRRYFGRIYEEQGSAGAERERALLSTLRDVGVPCAAPVGAGKIPLHQGKPVALYPWVDGDMLCYGMVTEEHCRRIGAALARVHLTPFQGLEPGRFEVADMRERLDAVEDCERPDLVAAAQAMRRLLDDHAARRDPGIPRGIIHGDLFRDNVLWHGPEIAALLDFESAAEGPFAFDFMVTVYAWCFGDDFDLERVAALLAGYEAVRPITDAERAAMKPEAAFAALRFAITRMTDFSLRTPPGETPKRDYRRFLERLQRVQAGALDAVLRLP